MTKKEAIQILQDREEQIADLAEAFSEGTTFDWVGCVLSAIMKGVPEAISALEEETNMTDEEMAVQKLMDCERDLREARRKQAVLNKLCETLQITENAWDLQSLVYCRLTGDRQVVDVEWQSGYHKLINVSGDSDTAMIRDIMNHLEC